MAMNEKKARFAKEYIIDLNATRSAIRAGYSEKTAYSQGQRLLKDVDVQALIQKYMNDRTKRTELTADMVVKELGKIAFSDVRNIYTDEGRMLEPFELSDDAAATISSFKVTKLSVGGAENDMEKVTEEYKRHDKTKALELLGRHFGIFTDKVEHSGATIQRVINVNPSKKKEKK